MIEGLHISGDIGTLNPCVCFIKLRRCGAGWALAFLMTSFGVLALSGCASQPPTAPASQPKPIKIDAGNQNSSDPKTAGQKPPNIEDNIQYPLIELNIGGPLFDHGDYFNADQHFANATKIMDRITGNSTQETTAVVLDETNKVFIGQPYERATMFLYRGICHFNMGDYSGALAAFRSSLVANEETRNSNDKFKHDFTISQLMAALCYERLGEPENVQSMLDLARKNAPNPASVDAFNVNHNFIAVIGVGEGPFRTGARTFMIGKSPEKKIELDIDQGNLNQPTEETDLLFQAQNEQWGDADTARLARETGKAIVSGILNGIILAATQGMANPNINIQDQEDIRSWTGLPYKFYIFTGNVPVGTHTITLKAYDEKGVALARDQEVWFEVPVAAQGGPILYLRMKQNWQNEFGLLHVPLQPATDATPK